MLAVPRITISYRREDSGVITGRIFDRLAAHYGRDSVFRDIDNIPAGVDFRRHIGDMLTHSDVVLAIVGPDWKGTQPIGNRLGNESDPVRLEIEGALRAGVPIVPVLVLGATMPQPSEMPDSIRDFVYRNAVRIDAGQDFDVHIARLVKALNGILKLPDDRSALLEDEPWARSRSRRGRPVVLGLSVALVLLVFAIVGALYFLSGHRGDWPTASVAVAPNPPSTGSAPPSASAAPTDAELVFWQSISASADPADFRAYLSRYPDGRFAGLARNRLTSLSPPVPARPACGSADEQIMEPVKLLYQAVNTKNLDLYAKQWTDDGRYVDVRTGVTETKAQKVEERRNRFGTWDMVNLTMDRATVARRDAEGATVNVVYTMTVKSHGRPPTTQSDVAERYDLVCSADGRWLIQANIDEN